MFIETMKRFSLHESAEPVVEEPVEGDPPAEGGGAPPAEPPEIAIPLSSLPEDMRNMSIPEIQFSLGRLVTTIKSQGENNERLRQELQDAKALPPAPPEPDPHEGKTLQEIFEEDAEAGVMHVLQKRGMLQRFDSTVGVVGELVVDQVAASVAGFKGYEVEVKDILKESGVVGENVTREAVLGAYTMAVGARTLKEKSSRDRELQNPETPTGDPPEPTSDLPELVGLEKEIFVSSGMTRERYEAMKADDVEIKTPISPAGL